MHTNMLAPLCFIILNLSFHFFAVGKGASGSQNPSDDPNWCQIAKYCLDMNAKISYSSV